MNLLYLTILFPLLGFLILSCSFKHLSEGFSTLLGVGSVGVSALLTGYIAIDFITLGQLPLKQELWVWIKYGSTNIPFTLSLDTLSMIMLSVVTGVGFLIHLFASWYMRGSEGYSRFFAYTNLFIASMIVLILSDNLALMFFGWEGVGVCSYLLIGFYYKNSKNGKAAMKAFIITRIGDIFLIIAILLVYDELGSLTFNQLPGLAAQVSSCNDIKLNLITLLILGGAVGKSAQLPLQTWLADAMAGPTPVSAMIHAATMVTAGVYLIARCSGIFLMTPQVLSLVAYIGSITIILAGCSALVQTDIKRILAYSTMSQIGYMFLALGVQAWEPAILHLVSHAFFKALLFLSAASVISACHHEQDIFSMGGLRKYMPLVHFCFLVGGSALAALPVITVGFYSKEAILTGVLVSGHNGLLIIALIGAFLTPVYTFRMIFTVFYGSEKYTPRIKPGLSHNIPLLILLILSTCIGTMIRLPLSNVFPETTFSNEEAGINLEIVSSLLSLLGIFSAAILWLWKRSLTNSISSSSVGKVISQYWLSAWGFDELYDRLFVRPYITISGLIRQDPLSKTLNTFSAIIIAVNRYLTASESGHIRWYITSVCLGSLATSLIIFYMT